MTESRFHGSEGSRAVGKMVLSRGRGFTPAQRGPEGSVGRFSAPRYPINAAFMDNWEKDNGRIAKVDWSLARRHDTNYNDIDPVQTDYDRNYYSYSPRYRKEWEDIENNGPYNPSRIKRERLKKLRDGEDPMSKHRSEYIPFRSTESDDEIFESGIASGINFYKYDEIEVKISGENPVDPVKSFKDAGLKPVLLDVIKKCNYIKPTPIQKYAMPIILEGRDLMACAQTGSGKTAAFLIPIINKLMDDPRSRAGVDEVCTPRALVVAPTRELSVQIFNEARKYTRGTPLRAEVVYGGTSISHQVQTLMVRELHKSRGCDILVGTPGRLLDISRRGKVLYITLKFVVFDEADKMLDLGFLPEMKLVMERILGDCKTPRQTVMFSATFPEQIQRIAGKFLHNYLFVAVGIVGGACSDVEQTFYEVSKFDKRAKLVDLLVKLGSAKALVFVELKRTTDVLATFLSEKNFKTTSIHGGREQREREEALEDFKNGRMRVLVATSVAARGLDIKNVAAVVNYDLPKTIDDYVHRIGRTGRVGNKGTAISFFDELQDAHLAPQLVKVLIQTGQKIPDFLLKYNEEGKRLANDETLFGGVDVRNSRRKEFDDLNAVEREEEETW